MGQRAIRTAAVDPLQMGFPCIRRIIEVARESLLSPGDVRLPRLHALLGQSPQWNPHPQNEDPDQPIQPGAQVLDLEGLGMGASPPPATGATAKAQRKVARARCLLPGIDVPLWASRARVFPANLPGSRRIEGAWPRLKPAREKYHGIRGGFLAMRPQAAGVCDTGSSG